MDLIIFKCALLYCLLELLISMVAALPNSINNSLIDLPEVFCGPESILVGALTEENFNGVVYIKNWRRNKACYQSYNNATSMVTPSLEVALTNLSECGMEMRRNAATREVEISGVWVFSFHQRFVTKVDRAFSIHCIFKQKEVTVTNAFDINDLVTRDILTGMAEMPNIQMKIVPGSEPILGKETVDQVRVGDPITLVWYTPVGSDMYGIQVKDCFVETLKGNRVKIIEQGCSLDDVVVSELRTSPDMSQIFALSHAFKFADAADVWFKCSVAACMKHNETVNSRITGNQVCGTAKDCGRVRQKRDIYRRSVGSSLNYVDQSTISLNDLITEERLFVADFYNQAPVPKLDNQNKKILVYRHQPSKQPVLISTKKNQFCMRKPVFALVSSVIVLTYITAFILGALAIILHYRRKNDSEFLKFDLFRLSSSRISY